MSNLISPYEAIAIPKTMVETFASFFISGAARPKIHVAMSVATAFVAYRHSLVYQFKIACL